MFEAILISLALAMPALSAPAAPQATDPKDMDPAELIKYWGYKSSSVVATTTDGYLLTLYRIQYGKSTPTTPPPPQPPAPANRPVVLLLHGFETSAADWLINPPNRSAPLIFADGGFDVFIGSFRGSRYGRQHRTWDSTTDIFWQFSWDEMAQYDLPAMIDTVLKTTNSKQIYLVSHSTGATATLAMLTNTKTPNLDKIKQVHLMAPLTAMANTQGPLKFSAPFMKDINIASALFGVDEFKPNPELQKSWAKAVCKNPETDFTCKNFLLMLAGPNTRQIDESKIDVINAHSPGGTSVRTAVHLAQMITSGLFQAYDFGNPKINQQHYGRSTPPLYNLASITTSIPTYVYSSECDWIAEPLDVSTTAGMMTRNLVSNLVVPSFNHMDYIWGTRAAGEIYEPIMAAMAQDFMVMSTPHP